MHEGRDLHGLKIYVLFLEDVPKSGSEDGALDLDHVTSESKLSI